MGDYNEKTLTSKFQENNRFTPNKENKYENNKKNGHKKVTPKENRESKNSKVYYQKNNTNVYDNNQMVIEWEDEQKKRYDQMEEEKMQHKILCQKELNIQLFLRRQKNYNNTFKNCYTSLEQYLKNPCPNNKGNFLWTLDCCCSMVNFWKKEYPEYEPQFNKEFQKDKKIQEIEALIKKLNKNDENAILLNKFYQLLNNHKQNFEEDEKIMKHFPGVQACENNTINNANNLLEIQRKIERENEREEFYGYPGYDVDEKIRHLLPKKSE